MCIRDRVNADDETQSVPGEPQAPNDAADDAGPTQSRRGFFRLGVAGALGTTALGGAAGAVVGNATRGRDGFHQGEDRYAKLSPRHAPGFDHIVVVMGENRSFDNLLGYLYDETNLPEGQTLSLIHI